MSATSRPPPPLPTPAQLAERWSCAVGSLANQRHNGEGPAYVKVHSRVLYPVARVEEYEAARLVRPVRGAAA